MTRPDENNSDSAVADYFRGLQPQLVAALEGLENRTESGAGKFVAEEWQSALGTGVGMALEGGEVWERAGVNFSQVSGASLPPSATARRPELAGEPFSACGVSLVAHPRNPRCPTAHLNVRFFRAGSAWWFGGGTDLTPHYGFVDDCRHFHRACKSALDGLDAALYPKFKAACDEYFFIPHRGETRGIGGVFFDDFCARDFAFSFGVARAVGGAFVPAYIPIAERRCGEKFGERERAFQLWRRGRYAEFNLVYDRGTLFGLQSGGRAESVLMSMPPLAAWRNNWTPEPESEEGAFVKNFLRPRDWLGEEVWAGEGGQ